jgi:hypothetical protein
MLLRAAAPSWSAVTRTGRRHHLDEEGHSSILGKAVVSVWRGHVQLRCSRCMANRAAEAVRAPQPTPSGGATIRRVVAPWATPGTARQPPASGRGVSITTRIMADNLAAAVYPPAVGEPLCSGQSSCERVLGRPQRGLPSGSARTRLRAARTSALRGSTHLGASAEAPTAGLAERSKGGNRRAIGAGGGQRDSRR